jgi:hypothetical protein
VQYNNSRTDANPWETVFTNANVPSLTLLAQFPVDATHLLPTFSINPVYAQPLYVPGLSIDGGTHNVVFVATLNGEVYAFDADNTAAPMKLWYRDETNMHMNSLGQLDMQGLKHNCDGSLGPGSSVNKAAATTYLAFAGVISTPVIDAAPESPNPAAIYIVNLCQDASSNQHWYINALNLTTGATLTSPPLEFVYNATDVAMNPYGPQQVFIPGSQLQRTGLLLTYSTTGSRSVIAGFGTSVNEQATQYQGWVFSFDATNPSNVVNQEHASPYITQCEFPPETPTGSTPTCSTNPMPPPTYIPDAQLPNPCGQGGGVWMSARGPASNA